MDNINSDIIIRNIKLYIISDGDILLKGVKKDLYNDIEKHFSNLMIGYDSDYSKSMKFIKTYGSVRSIIMVDKYDKTSYNIFINIRIFNSLIVKYDINPIILKSVILWYLKSNYKFFENYDKINDNVAFSFSPLPNTTFVNLQ